MACASIPYQPTKETTNACRVLHLLFGPCTDQFRDLLGHHLSPIVLLGKVKQNKKKASILNNLSKKKIDYKEFDITLIYTLLRNLSGVPPPIKGWGKDPDPKDFSEAGNIERIRILRNTFSHNQSLSLSDADFKTIWANTKRVIQDLDKILGNGGKYEKAMVPLEYMTMDPDETDFWRKELKRKHKEEISYKKQIKKVKRDIGKMKTTIDKLLTFSHIPENIQVLHKMTLDDWKKDDERYAETHFCKNLMKIINDNNIIVLTGGPGCGKTATSRHVAIKLLESDFTVIPSDQAADIKTYGHPEIKQVFLLDSAFGGICFQDHLHDEFRRNYDSILRILNQNSKLLITCRKDILIEARQLKIHSSLPQTVFDFEDEKNILTKEDRLSILAKYEDIEDCPVAQEVKEYVGENNMLPMFPLLCRMFNKEINYKNKGCSFFKEPYPIIMKHLDEIEREKILSYTSLVLCMLNGGHFSKSLLENDSFSKQRIRIYQSCKVKSGTDNWEIIDSLSQMVGTYLKECNGGFTFLHDLIFEVVACHFGKKCPQEIINRLSSEFISRRLTLEDIQEDRLKIYIPESEYKTFAKRLYRDLKDLRLYNVFASEFLHNTKVCDHFLSILDKDTAVDTSEMFLSPHSNSKDSKSISILFNQKLDFKEFFTLFLPNVIEDAQSIERIEPCIGNDEFGIRDDFNIYFVPMNCRIRLISWIIAYGHEKILRYIIEKMSSQKKDIGNLFGTDHDVESQTRYIFLACHSKNANILELVFKHVDNACKNVCSYLDKKERIYNAPFYKKYTPLTFSVLQENSDIVDFLLRAGADINALDAYCQSPLNCAIGRSNMSMIGKLVAAGADINKHNNIMSSLIYAAQKNNTETVEFLLRNEAHVNYLTKNGTSALYYASERGNVKMLNTLFTYGADYSIHKDKEASPFCKAAANGHLSVLQILSEHGADCNFVDEYENSPLSLASAGGFQDVVKYLIEKGADCNRCSLSNYTALIAAIENKHPDIACLLIHHGSDVNIVYKYDNVSPLHVAVKLNDTQTISELIKKFPNYRLKNSENMTPLEMSVWMGRKEITTSLVKGENLSEQGKGNAHLFDIIRKIRSSSLFFNTKDEIEARDVYQCFENDESESEDAYHNFEEEKMQAQDPFQSSVEEEIDVQDVYQPLYFKDGFLIERILREDEYGSLKFLLELGLRGDRLIMNEYRFWWQGTSGSMLPIKCVCHYIIQMSVENRNIQLLRLLIDHKFQNEPYTEYIRQPFIFESRQVLRNLEPDSYLSFIDQVREKSLKSFSIRNGSFNKYFMDNSSSILHLLSKRLAELEFWKEANDMFIDFYQNVFEEEEKEFINKAIIHLHSKIRRHSV